MVINIIDGKAEELYFLLTKSDISLNEIIIKESSILDNGYKVYHSDGYYFEIGESSFDNFLKEYDDEILYEYYSNDENKNYKICNIDKAILLIQKEIRNYKLDELLSN